MNDSSTTSRTLVRVDTTPPAKPGFVGAGHTAVEVMDSTTLEASDPFVLLMDDRLDMATRRRVGGPHPHAGLETVTLILEGSLRDRDEGDLGEGDVIWMTAGRGIVHNESLEAEGKARVLQLWIALPARDRDLPPQFQIVRGHTAPVIRAAGALARLYSGDSGGLRSPTRNRVPVTMIDLELDPDATFEQDLQPSYNGFLYVLRGRVSIGATTVAAGQVGWLAPGAADKLVISARGGAARLVLYAGQPIGESLVQHGPFVAGSLPEINELYKRFRAGRFTPMSQLQPTSVT